MDTPRGACQAGRCPQLWAQALCPWEGSWLGAVVPAPAPVLILGSHHTWLSHDGAASQACSQAPGAPLCSDVWFLRQNPAPTPSSIPTRLAPTSLHTSEHQLRMRDKEVSILKKNRNGGTVALAH